MSEKKTSRKKIQIQFGEHLIKAFTAFACAHVDDVETLMAREFSHVADRRLRLDLARIFYGTRWLYKLGLGLVTKKHERAAHVRSQVIQYGSICEALLSYCLSLGGGGPSGCFARLIPRSMGAGILTAQAAENVDWLRQQRNAVHLQRCHPLGRLGQAKRAYFVTLTVIAETKAWVAARTSRAAAP